MPAAQSNSITSNPNSQPSPPTSDRSNPTTRNGEFYHGDAVWSIRASALMPEMTEEDRREWGLDDVDGDINPPNQRSQGTSPTAAHNSTPNRTPGDPDELLYLADFMNRREDVNSQGLDSTPSASDGTAPADTYSRTPNNTPQANGEGDIHGRRAGMLNNASHDQPTATNIDDILSNWSPEESRALTEAFHSRNDEPSVCMSEFMTHSPDRWDLFYNNSSGTPLATAAENPALLSVPLMNHFNPQADHSNRTSFSNSLPATHTVTNSTSEEASPARLSEYLPRADPATQEQREVAWMAELSTPPIPCAAQTLLFRLTRLKTAMQKREVV